MAKQHYITKSVVAAMLGATTRTVETWEAEEPDPLPIAVRGGRGRPHKYDIAAVHQWALRRRMAEIYGDPDDGRGVPDFNFERARMTRAKADQAELDLAEQQGLLIRTDTVRKAWAALLANFRARVLALPVKAAPLVAVAESTAEARDILERACHEALSELAGDGTSRRIGDATAADLQEREDGKAAA